MDWIVVISLLLSGMLLIISDILLFPGTFVTGILGAILSITGVVLSFMYFGNFVGTLTLAGTLGASSGLTYYALSTKTWRKLAHKGKIEAKFDEDIASRVQVGQIGTTLSDLRPIGKAEINNEIFEVSSATGRYVDSGTKIKVIKLKGRKVIVKKID